MSKPSARRSTAGATSIDILIASLPLLASLAVYLPSGVLMPFRLATLALVGLTCWQLVSTRRIAAPKTLAWVVSITACIVVFGAIGIVRFSGRTSLDDVVRLGYLVTLVVAVTILAARRRTLVWLVAGWVGAGIVCAAPALWEVTTGHHLPKHSSAIHATTIPGWNIIASFFDNPNLYAYHCTIVLLVAPVAFFALPGRWRWAVLPLGVLIGYLALWTQGRIAVLAAVLGLGLWAMRSRPGRWLAAAGVAAFAVASWLKLSLAMAVWAEFDNAIVEGTEIGASTWVRMQLARSGWWITQHTGYLGTGPGGFASWALDPGNPYEYEMINNAHWGMLEVLVDFGVVTLGVVVATLITAAAASIIRARRAEPRTLDGALLYAPAVLALTLPIINASHSTWLQQPLSAAHVATLVALLAWGESRRKEPA